MIFYILISIVFIAEIIITLSLILYLMKLSKMFAEYNSLLTELKPKLKEIMHLFFKISEQMIEFSTATVNSIKSIIKNVITSQIKSITAGLVFWIVKSETEKRLTK